MRKLPTLALAVALALALWGCLSPQTRLELIKSRESVAALQRQVEDAELSRSANLAHLRQQLEDARARLGVVETKANQERVELTAGAVEQGANALGPLASVLFPGAALALGAIGAGAGMIRRGAKKRTGA